MFRIDNRKSTDKSQGFTLIELIIVLAVLSIMLGLALPNLRGTIARNQLLGQANEMAGAIALARSEAVTRGTQAGICASADGKKCSGKTSDWNKYTLVFADSNRDGTYTQPSKSAADDGVNDWLLRSFDANEEVTHTSGSPAIFFNETGFNSVRSQITVQVCHEKLSEHDGCRLVTIAPSGAVTVRHHKAAKA